MTATVVTTLISRHPLRRLRHAALAALARAVSQAAAAAASASRRCCRRRSRAWSAWPTSARRSSSATRATASWWPSSCARRGRRRRRSSSSRSAAIRRRPSPLQHSSRSTGCARQGAGGDADPILLVLPADHVIRDVAAFQAAVEIGRAAAEAGKLVTFGVVPDRPETGYGYIRRAAGRGPGLPGAAVRREARCRHRRAVRGVRRVLLEQRHVHVPRRACTWPNSSATRRPCSSACEDAVAAATRDLDFTRLPARNSAPARSDSIDYAVMEKTDAAVVVPLDAGWSDVGSWSALQDALPRRRAGQRRRPATCWPRTPAAATCTRPAG